MNTKISPVVSSFSFGQADAVSLRSIADNLADSATFFWQLGRIVPAVDAIPAAGEAPAVDAVPESFDADPAAVGNVTLSGEAYAAWSGSNEELPALLLPLIKLNPAA